MTTMTTIRATNVDPAAPRAGNYRCRVGCGQTFLTEEARAAHEETCNGGVDVDAVDAVDAVRSRELPPRVRAALARREFRELLDRSSLGPLDRDALNDAAFGCARLTGVPDEQADWEGS